MKVLLVIDLQKEFYIEDKYEKVLNYINTHRCDYDKVVATVFKNKKDSNFVKRLGYKDCMYANDSSIEFKADDIIVKNTYTVPVEQVGSIDDIITIIGCDTDGCVLASLFVLFDNEYNFQVLNEYCYSSGGEQYDNITKQIIKRNIQH